MRFSIKYDKDGINIDTDYGLQELKIIENIIGILAGGCVNNYQFEKQNIELETLNNNKINDSIEDENYSNSLDRALKDFNDNSSVYKEIDKKLELSEKVKDDLKLNGFSDVDKFICPKCFQGLAMLYPVDDNKHRLIIYNILTGKLCLLKDNYEFVDNIKLVNDLINNEDIIEDDNIVYSISKDINIKCPICKQEVNSIDWFIYMHEHHTPYENSCKICGGEVVLCQSEKGTHIFKCESCGYSQTLGKFVKEKKEDTEEERINE